MSPESVEKIHHLNDEIVRAQQARNKYWSTLSKLRSEYHYRDYKSVDNDQFYAWVTSTWGIRVLFDPQGNITADYTVVDEKLYLMYLLKYGR